MGASNHPPSDALLADAAELRAGGATWEVVAARLGRAADTVRHWPRAYPDRWRDALFRAERRLAREAGAESVLILRALLRSDDEKVRRIAAQSLVNLWLSLARLDQRAGLADKPPPPLTSDNYRLVAFLEGQSDDQLARLTAALLASVPALGAGHALPDGGPRPG